MCPCSICLAVAPSDTTVLKISINSSELHLQNHVINCNSKHHHRPKSISPLEQHFPSKVKTKSICPVEVYLDATVLKSTTISVEAVPSFICLWDCDDCSCRLEGFPSLEHRPFRKVIKHSICPAVAFLDTAAPVKQISTSVGQITTAALSSAKSSARVCRQKDTISETQLPRSRCLTNISNNQIVVYGRTPTTQVSDNRDKPADNRQLVIRVTIIHTANDLTANDKSQRPGTLLRAHFTARVHFVYLTL